MKHGGLLTAVLILILCSLLGLASVSATDLNNDTLDDFQGDLGLVKLIIVMQLARKITAIVFMLV